MKNETRRNLWIGALLITIAVAGRWFGASADWSILPPNFTPVAAIGLFAGYLFASRSMALLVPLFALAISNLALDSYGSVWMGAVVYGSFMAAPLMGRWLRSRPTVPRAFASVVLPALLFFLTTNFAHWVVDLHSAGSAYAASWSGLMACYARGVPFFRWMLEGDVAFSALLFGAYFLAAQASRMPWFATPGRRKLAPAHASAANSRC